MEREENFDEQIEELISDSEVERILADAAAKMEKEYHSAPNMRVEQKDEENSVISHNGDEGETESTLLEEDQEEEPEEGKASRKGKKSLNRKIKDFIQIFVIPILVGIIIALILSQVMFFHAEVPSGSMETTILTGDRILGNRMVYWFQKPTYGEIIIFWNAEYNEFMVKRIVACPGDHVEIRDDGVYVNDKKLSDSYSQGVTKELHEGESEWDVPENSYFVMGDNRENSADSRYWIQPFVPEEEVYARYMFRYSLGRNGWYLDWNDQIAFWEEQ